MNKKIAMSALGYVIVLIIILGIVMIISAPMMADKYKKNGNPSPNSDNSSKYEDKDDSNGRYDSGRDNYEERRRIEESYRSESGSDYVSKSDLEQIENKFSSKFYDVERRISDVAEKSSSTGISDKYVCSIEGFVDSAGNVKEIGQDPNVDIRNQKIVFVCEYRK